MKEYTFTQKTAKKVMTTQALSRIPVIIIALIGGFFMSDSQNGGHIFDNKVVLILASSIGIIACSVGLYFGIIMGTNTLMQNRFTMTDTYIERYTPSGKTVKLDFDKIEKHQIFKKGLLLKSTQGKILIPTGLDEFDELSKLVLNKLK